jgi:hypothetical protein
MVWSTHHVIFICGDINIDSDPAVRQRRITAESLSVMRSALTNEGLLRYQQQCLVVGFNTGRSYLKSSGELQGWLTPRPVPVPQARGTESLAHCGAIQGLGIDHRDLRDVQHMPPSSERCYARSSHNSETYEAALRDMWDPQPGSRMPFGVRSVLSSVR